VSHQSLPPPSLTLCKKLSKIFQKILKRKSSTNHGSWFEASTGGGNFSSRGVIHPVIHVALTQLGLEDISRADARIV
jgi:hypothetical protein